MTECFKPYYNMARYLRIIYIFLLSLCLYPADTDAQGLLFDVAQKPIKERTSYQVFKDGCQPTFKGAFTLGFELSIRSFDNFGYIFCIGNGTGHTTYSLTYTYLNRQESLLKFNTDGKREHLAVELDNDSIRNRWMHVRFDFDPPHDRLSVTIDGKRQDDIHGLGMQAPFTPQIYFGRYDYILDIPSFAIRNLTVKGDRKQFDFPLNESRGNDVHDTRGRKMGTVESPDWMMGYSYHWKMLYESRSQSPAGIAFDEQGQRLLLFNQDSLQTYLPERRELSAMPYATPLPVRLQLGTCFLNTSDGRLYAYELNNLPLGDVTVAALDSNLCWQAVGTSALPVQLHHHTGHWDGQTNRYLVFGGFGNKRYSNSFLTYAPEADRWDTLHFEGRISPRYFAGMTVDDDGKQAYLYGGMGNESGDQSTGRNYYHDLYRIDFQKKSIEKLWDKPAETKRVAARNMVLAPDRKSIYLITYPEYLSETYLQLYRLSIAEGTLQALGDSIPMRSDEITTNANLYYNRLRHELYCTTQEFSKDGQVTSRIYSLAAPPVSLAEMDTATATAEGGWQGWAVAALLPVAAACAALLFLRRRGKAKEKTATRTDGEPGTERTEAPTTVREQMQEPAPAPAPAQEEKPGKAAERTPEGKAPCKPRPLPLSPLPAPQHTSNALFLFGPFTVVDRKGIDISHLFTTRLRQVFIYILLHSARHGVLSSSLNEIFWSDKSDDKVKNLKGVTINQLRKLLAELDGISLDYEKGYFRITVRPEECHCDYHEFCRLALQSEPATGDDLLSLLIRGKFLEGESCPALDGIKAEVEGYLCSYLPLEVERRFRQGEYEWVVKLCNALTAVDPLNTTALSYAVHTLDKTGHPQDSILLYSAFIKRYKQLMGEEFGTSYKELVEKKPA